MQDVPDLRLGVLASGNSNSGMLIDVHAHFYHAGAPRSDWHERNASRLAAGRKIGVTIHVASILGSWGRTSPIYFPSPRDVEAGNTALLALGREHSDVIRGYVTVNPNYTSHARGEIVRCLGAGMVGIKLAASRRATDPLLDPICELARERGVPVLHHVWQHRTRDWPGQEASDGPELVALATRHPQVRFILAHIGGGGDWEHSLAALRATSPDGLLHAMTRAGIDEAWVSHLPSLFWRQPMEGNAWLYATAAREPRFKPVPALHPGLSGWEGALGEAADRAAPAGRCDPLYYELDPAGPEMRVLAAACGAAHLPLMMAVRLEDGRQRHPNDRAGELPAAAVRALIRSDEDLRLLITHADRGFIEEVHFGSTPEEAARLWWDVSWIWGPPEDHLETLLGTIGIDRFGFGTGQPLRIPEASMAKLDLLDLAPEQRAAIDSENARGGLLR